MSELEIKYNELLYSVETKFKNETRHQTALRYIREAELVNKKCLESGLAQVVSTMEYEKQVPAEG